MNTVNYKIQDDSDFECECCLRSAAALLQPGVALWPPGAAACPCVEKRSSSLNYPRGHVKESYVLRTDGNGWTSGKGVALLKENNRELLRQRKKTRELFQIVNKRNPCLAAEIVSKQPLYHLQQLCFERD
ncbi:uncharacterized protein LOC120756121 isoform X2 [Hirundo rustica]|uniref:uncharacterized protein LOC120756121 isoform X2 n=1 Tax=Hirundo rustica TaxID=43150 RepID=UPI001A93BEE1|nr:uncharacterized protein LOC120756121 isoform X2 [Hirundo rustica]